MTHAHMKRSSSVDLDEGGEQPPHELNTECLLLDAKKIKCSHLTKKDQKNIRRATRLGMKYAIHGDHLVISPKIRLRKVNQFATTKEIRQLIIFLLTKHGKLPSFAEQISFQDVAPVTKLVVLIAPMMDPHTLQLPQETFHISDAQYFASSPFLPYMNIHENDAVATVTVNPTHTNKMVMSTLSQLVEVPLTKSNRKKQEEKKDDQWLMPEQLVHSLDELMSDNYPIHSSLVESELGPGWVETAPSLGQPKKVMALDCEMCKTVNGYAVTRVALIDRDRNVLINEHVKPSEEITDYVSHISGVTEESLKNITTTLSDIQQKILHHVNGDTLLLGHGLVNDMQVLKIRHPHILDTSILFHHSSGPPYKPSLRDLAFRFLNKRIQNHDAAGHDPCEDAGTCLDLLELKLRHGSHYGHTTLSDVETIFQFMRTRDKSVSVIECHASLSSLMKDELKKEKHYHSVESDQEVVTTVIQEHPHQSLVIANFSLQDIPEEQKKQARFTDLFKDVYDQLEPQTIVCVTTGYNANEERERLRKKKSDYKRMLKQVGLDEIAVEDRWTNKEERLLAEYIESTRRGLLFITTK
ncbi:hypothetical protein BDB01DRAFT_836081 [Pilobolus umbonatus]|nr:hypothetical protein BDB01DRAFT_836081 [Pilobolus umbonatus]